MDDDDDDDQIVNCNGNKEMKREKNETKQIVINLFNIVCFMFTFNLNGLKPIMRCLNKCTFLLFYFKLKLEKRCNQ